MSKLSEPISNNQTILLGRTSGSNDVDLFVVNYDEKENVYIDQIDLQTNGVSVNGSDEMYVCVGSGSFTPSAVPTNTYTIKGDTISSTQGCMSGMTIGGIAVSFRLAQIISVNSGEGGCVIFGVVNTESISSTAGDCAD